MQLNSRVAAGVTFQLPRRRDVGPHSKLFCRDLPCLLVAVACLAGRWCFWRLCSWRWFGEGRAPWTGFCRRYPLRYSWTLVPCSEATSRAGHSVVYFVTGQMVGDRWFPGDNTGSEVFTSSANHPLLVPPTGCVHRDALYEMAGATLRRHFLRAVAAAVIFVCVVAATSAWCRVAGQRDDASCA